MPFKLIRTFLPALALILFFIPAHASARSFTIDAVDINAFIFPDGDLYVEELYTYTFEGSFNGTTRIIGDDDFNGVEFFEGYQVADDAEMGKISQEDATPLKIEREDYTFKIHRPAENETTKVFYRYRLSDAIRKYEDVGEFYWRFFDEMGEDDINHLRVFVQLYGVNKLPVESLGFMHDLSGGDFQLTETGLYYQNNKLPGGQPFELRLLFPADFLSEMDFTEKEEMLPTFLKEEEKYDERLVTRDKWLPFLENVNAVIFFIFILLAVYSILFLRRLLRWIGPAASSRDIGNMDSFTLTAIYRKLKLKPQDVNAALFRLYQNGDLTVEHVSSSQDDESELDHTFKFSIQQNSANLSEQDQFLIDWLFTASENGKRVFYLDELPVQTNRKKHNETNNILVKEFKANYRKWAKIAAKDSNIKAFVKPVLLRKVFINAIIPVWMLWATFNLWIGMGERSDVLLGISIFAVYNIIRFFKNERVVSTIFFLILLFAFPEFGLDPGLEFLEASALPLIFISGFLPMTYPTYQGVQYFKGAKKWLKQLRKKELKIPEVKSKVEIYYQHAIALNEALIFMAHYGDKIEATQTDSIYPFLISPRETARIYSYNYRMLHSRFGSSSSGGGGSSGSSGGSGGGGGAGAF